MVSFNAKFLYVSNAKSKFSRIRHFSCPDFVVDDFKTPSPVVCVTCVRASAPSRKLYRRNFCSRCYKTACTKVLVNQLLKDFAMPLKIERIVF